LTEVPCAALVPAGIACFTAGGANLGGQMGLSGTLNVVVAPALVSIPLPLAAAGVGVGGLTQTPKSPSGFWIDAAPWTQGVGKVAFTTTSTFTVMTTLMGVPVTITSTNSWVTVARTTGGGGSVGTANSGSITLVTPTHVTALGNILPVFSRLEIHFVPEPSTALLLASGPVGIAATRRRRRPH
jgi:hypothetical protein